MKLLILIVLFLVFNFSKSEETTFPELVLEPYSIITGRPDGFPAQTPGWHIGIYIIFGRKQGPGELKYVLPSLAAGSSCTASPCVRGFGICIKIGRERFQELDNYVGSFEGDQKLGSLDSDKQETFLGLFNKILENADQIEPVEFWSPEGVLVLPAGPIPAPGITEIDLILGSERTTEWAIKLSNALIMGFISEGPQIDLTKGSGAPVVGNMSTFGHPEPKVNTDELVPYTNFQFNRKLLQLYYCFIRFFNKFFCSYFTMLVRLNTNFGEELKIGLVRPSIIEAIFKWIRLIKKIIDWIFGMP